MFIEPYKSHDDFCFLCVSFSEKTIPSTVIRNENFGQTTFTITSHIISYMDIILTKKMKVTIKQPHRFATL